MRITQQSFSILLNTTLCLSAVWLLLPGTAQGYFTDTNNLADASSFAVGTVGVTLTPDSSHQDLFADTVTEVELATNDSSTLTTQSRFTFSPQSCRTDFYNEILLEVTTASGTSAGTFADTTVLETGVPDTYTLDVVASLDLVATANESCVILATLETWQAQFNEPDFGFSSIAQATITLTAPDPIGPQETTFVVLNELYPAVLSTTTAPLEREWVELYNGTAAAVDVAGWRIDEFVGGSTTASVRPHTIVSSCTSVTPVDHMQPFDTTNTVIPAGGFLVVEFCGSAPYLSDGGDTVQLYNAAGAQVDAHTYPATANGKSHARIPDGAAWVDPIPTPGNKNTATRADLEAEGWDVATINETLAKLSADGSSSPEVTTNSLSAVGTNYVGNVVTKNIHASTSVASSSVAAEIASSTAVNATTTSDSSTGTTSTSLATSSPHTASTTPATTTIESVPTAASSTATTTQTPDDTGDTNTASMSPVTTVKPAVPDDITTQTMSNLNDNSPVETNENEPGSVPEKDDDTTAEINTSDDEQKSTTVDQSTTAKNDTKEEVPPVTDSANNQANEITN